MTMRASEAHREEPAFTSFRLVQAGAAAFYVDFGGPVGKALSQHLRAFQVALKEPPPGVRDLIVGYRSLLVEHDPVVSQTKLRGWIEEVAAGDLALGETYHHDLPVQYGLGADREELEVRLGLSWDKIVSLHESTTYTVAFTGFTPGFPYLHGLPQALHLPRRESPRKHIPAGAVAVAAGQGGIYPEASPGGWWVLGQTKAQLFDPARTPPALLAAGDTLSFKAVSDLQKPSETTDSKLATDKGDLEVVQVWPNSASLQAEPRWHIGHYGCAQQGPLDPLAAELANLIVGNAGRQAALELVANPVILKAHAPLNVCLTGGGLRLFVSGKERPRWGLVSVNVGDLIELVPDKTVSGYTSYLAVQGGVQLSARYRTQYLKEGDGLTLNAFSTTTPLVYRGRPRYPKRVKLRLHPGPQYTEAAFRALLGSSFRVRSMNRMGLRLSGPPVELPAYDVVSEGSPWGAVQVPASGQPIILLADRGRTGGYAKPAVCDVNDLWQLAQAPPGTEIWFVAA